MTTPKWITNNIGMILTVCGILITIGAYTAYPALFEEKLSSRITLCNSRIDYLSAEISKHEIDNEACLMKINDRLATSEKVNTEVVVELKNVNSNMSQMNTNIKDLNVLVLEMIRSKNP